MFARPQRVVATGIAEMRRSRSVIGPPHAVLSRSHAVIGASQLVIGTEDVVVEQREAEPSGP